MGSKLNWQPRGSQVAYAAFEPCFYSHILGQVGMHVMHLVEGRHFKIAGGGSCKSAYVVRNSSRGRGCRGGMNGGVSAVCRLSYKKEEREKRQKRLCIVMFENVRQSSFIPLKEVRLKCAAGFDSNQHVKPCELPCPQSSMIIYHYSASQMFPRRLE